MRDIELGRTVFQTPAVRILRLFKFAAVHSVARSAGGEVVHRIGERFAVSVRSQQGEALRKPSLQLGLQRVVVRDPEIFENLNIAIKSKRTQLTRSHHRCALRIERVKIWIQVAEAWQL